MVSWKILPFFWFSKYFHAFSVAIDFFRQFCLIALLKFLTSQMLFELQAFNGVLHAFFKSLSCMEFLANNPLLFLYFLVKDCFIYFWIQHSCKNVQLILKCLKPPFLLQFLSWLMIFLMILFIILLSMLMIQLFWENSMCFIWSLK